MFKKKGNQAVFYGSNSLEIQTIIGPSVEVKGDFEGQGDVIVEGKLEGTLKTKDNLRIGPSAEIMADIEAENIYVGGKVKGNIKAKNEIELAENSVVVGDLVTQSLIVERGAMFNGHCLMAGESGVKKEEKGPGGPKRAEENGMKRINPALKEKLSFPREVKLPKV